MFLTSSVFQCFSNFNVHVVHLWLLLKCRFLFSVCMCMCVCELSHVWLFAAPGLYLPGSSIHRISQAKILKQVGISYSRGSPQPLDRTCIFCVSCIAGGFLTSVLAGKPLFIVDLAKYTEFLISKQVMVLLQRLYFESVQFSCSVVSDSVIPWTAACQDSLSVNKSRRLLKLMFIELVLPSNCLILCLPLLSLPSVFPRLNQDLFQWVNSSHKVTKVLEFQLQHQSF